MKISIIVAAAQNNAIGKDNQLLWHLPNDMKMFKTVTSGHCVIMGRKTFEALGKPLPKRTNIIITRQKDFQIEGCLIAGSIEEGIAIAKNNQETEAFVIGGGQIYEKALQLTDRVYLTRVHADFAADAFFPVLNPEWKLISSEKHYKDEKHAFDYDFEVWER